MCLYPTLIDNPKYKANKKNKGVIPNVGDERIKLVPIGCGNCYECRKKKQREWIVRLEEEIKEKKNGKFITLTFDKKSLRRLSKIAKKNKKDIDGYELDNEIARIAVRRWTENYRVQTKKNLRHWLITELGHGKTEHLHMHGIIWVDDINEATELWKYGYVWDGKKDTTGRKENYVNGKTIGYIVKYITKIDEEHKAYKPKIYASKGIGAGYMKRTDWEQNVYKPKDTDESYTTKKGHRLALPIYYRNKIYNEDEREDLWIQKLDEQKRYVWGEEVSIRKNDKKYNILVNWYREKNKRLGYGKHISREEKEYERKRRIIIQNTRIAE